MRQQFLKRRLCSSAVVFVLAQDQQLPFLTGKKLFFIRHEKHSMLLSTFCNVVFTRTSYQLVALLLSCSAAKDGSRAISKKAQGRHTAATGSSCGASCGRERFVFFFDDEVCPGLVVSCQQGTEFPEIDRAVKVKLPKNFQRCLDQDLRKFAALPKPMEADIPMQGGPTTCASSAILLPHETVHGFFNSAQGWVKCILPDTD